MKCPECGKEVNWLEAVMDDELMQIIKLQPEFDGYGKLAFEYVELFGVSPLKLKSKKILRLLKEVLKLFKDGQFEYQKKGYRISRAGVAEAMKVCCNKHFQTPLEDHNYLKKVMISISEKEATERSKAEEKALRAKEQRLNNEHRTLNVECSMEKGMTAEEYKQRQGIESLAGMIGKKI